MRIVSLVVAASVTFSIGLGVHAQQGSSTAPGSTSAQAGGRAGGAAAGSSGQLIGGSGTIPLTPVDARGWGWQVKASVSPATPRPFYNKAKELLFQDKQITSYTVSSYNPDLYCEVGKHFDYIWFEMQHSTMSWDDVRRMMLACPGRRRRADGPHARRARVEHSEGDRYRRQSASSSRRSTTRWRRGMRRGSRATRRSAGAALAADRSDRSGRGSTTARRSTTTCSSPS